MNLPNHTTLIGRILRDPELYEPPGGGLAKTTFTLQQRPLLAVPGRPRDPEARDLTLRCIAWRDLAHKIAETLHADDQVIVLGHLTQRVRRPPGQSPHLMIELTIEAIGPLL
ncbi:single-stranded DNA-binding protein [Kitasatospora sp. NPDC088779]|uniref:single-stranded DNA-binding protein n=1 Tax=unclassified Kitasatospora TaxID=2633591 RepID=UPI00342ED95F